jgi:Type IV secretion-system coupling protein DNA-binding domain
MSNIYKWGRNEATIWPPHGPIYTWGALFLGAVFCAFCLYIRFALWLSPLERYYLPYYLRSDVAGLMRPAGKYQLLYVLDSNGRVRPAHNDDVKSGLTAESDGKTIPLELAPDAAKRGARALYREPIRMYQNKALYRYLAQWVYGGLDLTQLFSRALLAGISVLPMLLPFSIRKDIARRKQLRYGRRLRGPEMLEPAAFTEKFQTRGLGLVVNRKGTVIRLPQLAENKHLAMIGDTGSGKSTAIRQILLEVKARGDNVILYDSSASFLQQFYDEKRGDIVLNPTDKRCPYWSPVDEVEDMAEAETMAAAMFEEDPQHKFFVEGPRKIFAYLVSFGPSPAELVAWMSNPAEIDKKVKGTEMEELIDPHAPAQRSGVLGSLGMVANGLRYLPPIEKTKTRWTAREWAQQRKGWIFITSFPAHQKPLRPLISVWFDLLVMRLLTVPEPHHHPSWFVIDELADLQKLPSLHMALTQNRKWGNPIVLGFQNPSQIEANYGRQASSMLSQPGSKMYFRVSDPPSAKWVSQAIGEVEIERLKETHYDGTRTEKNFALDRQIEPLVMASEVEGLPDLHGYLKYENSVTRFRLPRVDLPQIAPDLIKRDLRDVVRPIDRGKTPKRAEPPAMKGEQEAFSFDTNNL